MEVGICSNVHNGKTERFTDRVYAYKLRHKGQAEKHTGSTYACKKCHKHKTEELTS